MKKTGIILLALILAGAVSFSGCSRKETTFSPASTPTPAASSPSPTATPEPTPVPYDLVAEETIPSWHYAASETEVRDALLAIREAAADQRFSSETFPDAPTCAHLSGAPKSGDRIVSDGRYIYILSGKNLAVFLADGSSEELISQTLVGMDWTGGDTTSTGSVSGYEKTPLALYPAGDRLAVVYNLYGYENAGGEILYTDYIGVDIYDISDPSAPVLTASYGQDGSLKDAGLQGSVFYMVTESSVFDDSDSKAGDECLPRLYTDDVGTEIPADRICITDGGTVDSFAVIGLYDLSGPARLDAQAVLGPKAEPFAADGRLFFLSDRWAEGFSRAVQSEGGTLSEYAVTACTDVFSFTIEDRLTLNRAFTINGQAADSRALDFQNGVLRAAVSLRQRRYTASSSAPEPAWGPWETGNAVYLLDGDFHVIGKTESVSDEGRAVWIGFLGQTLVMTMESGRSYPVDLSDPAMSRTGSPLSEPISAAEILPWGSDGYMAFYRTDANRLTLSVRDAQLRELAVRTFGSDHSNTLENADCYLSDADANILAFAADDSYCVYGFDEETGLVHRLDVFLQDWAWNARGFVVGDRLYVADSRELFAYNLEELTEEASFDF